MARLKMVNEVTLTFRISNDFENRKAIREVSDKMIVISGYKTCGKNNPIICADIVVFRDKAKNPTETTFTKESFPKSGDYIDVTGNLTTEGYTDKDGNKRTRLKIMATKIDFTKHESDEQEKDMGALWE